MSWDHSGGNYRHIQITDRIVRAVSDHLGPHFIDKSDVGGELIADLRTGTLTVVRDEYKSGDRTPSEHYTRNLFSNGAGETSVRCYEKTQPDRRQVDPDCISFSDSSLVAPWSRATYEQEVLRGQRSRLTPAIPWYKQQEVFIALVGSDAFQTPAGGSERRSFFAKKEVVIRGLRHQMGLE